MKKNRAGFTLIEMIVTVGLFTIIIMIAAGGFTNAVRTQRQVSSLISAQSNVSLAVEEMSREIRDGYLFCHDVGSSTYSSACDDEYNVSMLTCTIVDRASNTWNCPSLDFYDAEGNHINYSSENGALTESINGAAPEALTGNTVAVKYLSFRLFGQTEGDHWPPRITISMSIAPSSTDPAVENDVFNLETTVSARTIDCTTGSNPQC